MKEYVPVAKDCEHCSKKRGSFGCCSTVSNNWVYACVEGHKEWLLNKISTEVKALEQEQDKPMVEIDLYSVIKQKYIEREVLDEIRAEIEEQVLESLSDGGDDWFTAEKVNECLDIIDKYRTGSGGKK